MANVNWDSGVPYNELKKTIKTKLSQTKNNPERYTKLLVYAIQLRNAGRVSEGLEALKFFANGTKPDVRVRKKKATAKPDYRAFIWPEFLKQPKFDKNTLSAIEKMKVGNVKVSARGLIGVNTHSLRYARITALIAQHHADPLIVAKITHHSDPKFILKYFQQKQADELNERVR